MNRDNRYFIEALHRGLRVLEAFSEAQPTLSLAEIVEAVALDKSTTFRLVYTLQELGYLERDPDSKRYRPGLEVLRLGFAALNSLDIAPLARPRLEKLSLETDETVNMALRDGGEIIYVVRITPRQNVNVNLRVGSRLPVHCTSMGKALLLDLSPDELRQLLGDGPYHALTPKTITALDDLLADLEEARQRGYATSDEELVVGVRSLAAPVRQREGDLLAAINISVPSARLKQQEMEARFAERVVATAQHLSHALGASP